MFDTLQRLAWQRGWFLDLREQDTPHLIEARMNCRNWTLELTVSPRAEERLVECGLSPLEQSTLIEGLVRHELGHWEICPFNAEGHRALIDGALKALLSGRRASTTADGILEMRRLVGRIVDLVADLVVNAVLSYEDATSAFAEGQFLLMRKELAAGRGADPWYDLFVRLSVDLYGSHTPIAETVTRRLPAARHAALVKRALDCFPGRRRLPSIDKPQGHSARQRLVP